MSGPAKPGKAQRPLRFVLHSLIGVKVSVLLAFVCLTGTIATVSHEIEWLAMPEIRATSDGRSDDWGGMWDAVRKAHPTAFIQDIGSYDRADSTYFARTATIVRADGTSANVFIDPASLRITGEQEGLSFHSFMRALHYYLYLPTELPFYLVTSLGFVLVALLITGLLTYRKFWRGFFRQPRWKRDARTISGDLHRLIGLWSLWFITIIAITSIWYFFERFIPSWEREQPQARSRTMMPTPTGTQLAGWIGSAKQRFPGLSITHISMPYAARDPVIVQGHWQAALVRERAEAVFIDPAGGRIIGARSGASMGLAERWVHTADPLHFGNFAGLAGKLVWALFGLCLTAMSVTGAIINAKRLR